MLSLRGVTAGAVVLFDIRSGDQEALSPRPQQPMRRASRFSSCVSSRRRPVRGPWRITEFTLRCIAPSPARSLRRHTVVAEAKAEQTRPPLRTRSARWLSADDSETAAPATFAAAEPAAPSPGAPVIGPLVIGNPPVEIASQNDVNALDLAADKAADAPATAPPVNATPNDTAPPSSKMAAMSAPARRRQRYRFKVRFHKSPPHRPCRGSRQRRGRQSRLDRPSHGGFSRRSRRRNNRVVSDRRRAAADLRINFSRRSLAN